MVVKREFKTHRLLDGPDSDTHPPICSQVLQFGRDLSEPNASRFLVGFFMSWLLRNYTGLPSRQKLTNRPVLS